MNTKAATFLKILGNKYHKGPFDMLLKRLPNEELEVVSKISTASQDISKPFTPPLDRLSPIHYSWLVPLIATETPERQTLLINALPQQKIDGVNKLLRKTPQNISLAPPLKEYLQAQMICKIGCKDLLPLEYVPQTELSVLGTMTKEQLVDVVDYLSIFDLADEIRHLVNKLHLKEIYAALTPQKHRFLRQCLYQKEKIATPRLHLENWHGTKLELYKLLHPRGLARLGMALSGQHPDLIWTIVHRLDVGRGKRVEHYAMQNKKPGVVFALTAQVINVVNFLNKSKS